MKAYIFKRVLGIIPIVLVIVAFVFFLIHVTPGDPAYVLIGEGGAASSEVLERIREEYGLNKPLTDQFAIYMLKMLQGDLGYSYTYHRPVLNLIIERLPATVLLMCASLVFSLSFGIVLGAISAKKPYSIIDSVITTVSSMGYSTPIFWIGILLMLVFSLYLGWFPIGGMQTPAFEGNALQKAIDMVGHLVLPTITLGMYHLAVITRMTRGGILEVYKQNYITMARAKGLSENRILFRHALKSALLPIFTVAGLMTCTLFSGSVLVETVFNWPGIGRLTYDSLLTRDYPLILGLFIFSSTFTVVANLFTDILYTRADPRIRYK